MGESLFMKLKVWITVSCTCVSASPARCANWPPVIPQWLTMGSRWAAGSPASSLTSIAPSTSLAMSTMTCAPAARRSWYWRSRLVSPQLYQRSPTSLTFWRSAFCCSAAWLLRPQAVLGSSIPTLSAR